MRNVMTRASAFALIFFWPEAWPLQNVHRFRARLRYDGANFHGVQKNKRPQDGTELRTILSMLEQSLWPVLEQQVRFRVASRTDAGVSASGQVVAFDAQSAYDSEVEEPRLTVRGKAVDMASLADALNAYLPSDLQLVGEVAVVSRTFDVGRDCHWKRYRYRLPSSRPDEEGLRLLRMVKSHVARAARERTEEAGGTPEVSPRRRRKRKSGTPPQLLDVAAMSRCAALLEGTHDFAAFQVSGGDQKSTVRTIFRCTAERRLDDGDAEAEEAEGVDIVVELDGALYKMVRIIAGTLAMVGMGLAAPETVRAALLCSEASVQGFEVGEVVSLADAGTLAEMRVWPKAELRRRGVVGPVLPPELLCLEHIEYDFEHCGHGVRSRYRDREDRTII